MSTNTKFWLSKGEFEALSTLNPGKFDSVDDLVDIGVAAKQAMFWAAMKMQGTGFDLEWEDTKTVVFNDGYDFNAFTVMRDIMENENTELPKDASMWANIAEPIYRISPSGGNNIKVDITTSGAGGLDTGTEAVSTLYYAYAIANSATPGSANGILSVKENYYDVTLPIGYDQIAPIACVYNSAGGDLLNFNMNTLKGGNRRYIYNIPQTVLTDGTDAAYADCNLEDVLPDWEVSGVWINLEVTGKAVFSLSIDGINTTFSTSTSQPMVFIPYDKLEYKRDLGSGSLLIKVVGFEFTPFSKF